MNQVEYLIGKSSLAFKNPACIGLISLARQEDRVHLVGKVKKVCQDLGLENRLAAETVHAARLARDFPDRFDALIRPAEPGFVDRERTMGAIELIGPRLNTRLPFTWGDIECELEIPARQRCYKYNLISGTRKMNTADPYDFVISLVGFEVKVHFVTPRKMWELEAKFRKLATKSPILSLEGLEIGNCFDIGYPFREDKYVLSNWWIRLHRTGERPGGIPHPERRIGYLNLTFGINVKEEGRLRPSAAAKGLNDADFRINLVKACLSHWLEVEVI